MQTATGALIRFLTGSSGGGGTGSSRQNTSVDVESGEQAEEAHQEEEKRVKNIIELANEAKADLSGAVNDTSQDSKVREYERQFADVAQDIADEVREHQQHVESVHEHVVEAESKGRGLNKVDQELESDIQEAKEVFSDVKEKAREARNTLRELEAEAEQTNGMSPDDIEVVNEAVKDFDQIADVALRAERLEIGGEKEAMKATEEEADVIKRYEQIGEWLPDVQESIENGNHDQAERIAQRKFRQMGSDQLKKLEKELNYIVEESEDVEQLEEGNPQEIENIVGEEEIILEFLRAYVKSSQA